MQKIENLCLNYKINNYYMDAAIEGSGVVDKAIFLEPGKEPIISFKNDGKNDNDEAALKLLMVFSYVIKFYVQKYFSTNSIF